MPPNETDNTGTFRADLELPEGPNVVTIEELREFIWRAQSPGASENLFTLPFQSVNISSHSL
jgi:hypothetical protein